MSVVVNTNDSVNDITKRLGRVSLQTKFVAKGISDNGVPCENSSKIRAGMHIHESSPDFHFDNSNDQKRKTPAAANTSRYHQPQPETFGQLNRTPDTDNFFWRYQNSPSSSSNSSYSQYARDRCASVDSSQVYNSPDSAYLKNESSSSDEDVYDFIKSDDETSFGTAAANLVGIPKELPLLTSDTVSGYFSQIRNAPVPPMQQMRPLNVPAFNGAPVIPFRSNMIRPGNQFINCHPIPVDPSLLRNLQAQTPAPPPQNNLISNQRRPIPQVVPTPQPGPTLANQVNQPEIRRGPGRPRATPKPKQNVPLCIRPSTSKNLDDGEFNATLEKFKVLSKKDFLKIYNDRMSIFHKVAHEEPKNFPALCQVYIMKHLVRETSFSLTNFTDLQGRTILFLLVEKRQLMNVKCLFQIANQDCTIKGIKSGESGKTSVFHMAVLYTEADSQILKVLISNVEKRLQTQGKKPQDKVLKMLDSKNRTPLQCLLEAIANSNDEKEINGLIENLKSILRFAQSSHIITNNFDDISCQDGLSFVAALPLAPRLLPLLVESLQSKTSHYLSKKYYLSKYLLDIVEDNNLIDSDAKSKLITLLKNKGAKSASDEQSVDIDESSNEDLDAYFLDVVFN